MKKKKLKSLKLHTYKISNLALLHQKVGGIFTTDTETASETNPGTISIVIDCSNTTSEAPSEIPENCGTNGGSYRTEPPTEYEGCHINSIGG
ncbi:hypothetical protein [Kordia jejudonensis]|uniref:hypothetical protein n=1 Tax=Kordia jejudonensis TaxID=1348245 RepID=UPI00062960A9|nr:hypothetical protein [Kordia jejudonensis]